MKTEADFQEKILDLALKGGASGAELYTRTSKRLSVEAKDGLVETVESSLKSGYSLRIIREGRLGFSYSTDPGELGEVVAAALESSKWTEADESLELPGPEALPAMRVHDPDIEDISRETAVESALLIEVAALKDSRIKTLRNCMAAFVTAQTSVHNTRGLAGSFSSTSATAQVMAMAEHGGDSRVGGDFQGARFLSDMAFESVGQTASIRAARLLGAKKTSPMKAPVVLEAHVAVEFLGIFSSMLSSEAVLKGKSLLKDRTGDKVISEHLSIVDDAGLPGLLGSRPMDDEGVPAARKTLIEQGILKGFMYNTSTARKASTSSTGNAMRPGISGVPGVGPTNLFIVQDNGSPDEDCLDLIAAVEHGLLVTEAMGVHMANPVSGDFSIGVSGLLIKGGELGAPVCEAVVSGNILDFMSDVRPGRDLRFYGPIGSPSLLVQGVDISA